MAAIDLATWLRQPAAQAVGWALLQFVWQGALVGALTALTLAALRRSASDVRYVVSAIGLALMLTLPVVTGVQKYQALRASAAFDAAHGTVFRHGILVEPDGTRMLFDRLKVVDPEPAVPPRDAASSTPTASERFVAMMPAFLVLWICGVSVLTLRLLTGWMWVQRLRRRGVSDADEVCRQMAARLARRLHITRAVTLLQSSLVDVPTVIGFLAPVVLLPASALSGLTAQQVEAILAHELAHIRRHDYLVNLLQTLVETVLFYHPAVWWLSRRIRVERENCCDDLAVSLCGDPVAYATALADLEALRSSGPVPDHHIAMAATGGSLLHRVRRLLGAPSSHSGRGPAWLAGAVALLLVGGIALGADGTQTPPAAVAAVEPAPAGPADIARMFAGALTPRLESTVAVLNAERQVLRSRHLAPPAAAAADAAITGVQRVIGSADPAPPAPQAAPAPPAPPAMPASPVPQSGSISHRTDNSNGNWVWSSNGEKLEVSYHGTFEFTDDDTDVREISPGGSLKVSDGNWIGRHSVEIRDVNGALEHRYYVNASERPFEPEGRAWLRQNLPKFVRNTGIGAEWRVARLLKSGGPSAVMTEIHRIDTAYVKGVYFRQLFKQASLSGDQYREAMSQASREMQGSSYELAQLLIAASENLPADEASRAAYFQAAAGIHSDYELRRVYSTMLKRGPVSSAILGGILANAKSIHSDYEVTELLRQILAQQPLDERNRAAFFSVVSTIGGAYERHRVLSAAIGSRRPSDPALIESALGAASSLHSDYETSMFLQEILRQNGIEGTLRAPFFAAVNAIGGHYERASVLRMVVKKSDASPDTLRAVLQSARGLDGYDLSQLLQLVASTHAVSGDVREAYLNLADRLAEYEQGQAMAALVRAERAERRR